MNLMQQLEKEQVAKLSAGKEYPDFQPGDTVIVNVKVVEGERTRIQAYEGVCIGRAGAGMNENFTVRKISYGEGVERVFPLYSPMIDSIKVVRRGKVRRAKLYYLRGLRGKSARITEKQDHRAEQRGRDPKAASQEGLTAGLGPIPLQLRRRRRWTSRRQRCFVKPAVLIAETKEYRRSGSRRGVVACASSRSSSADFPLRRHKALNRSSGIVRHQGRKPTWLKPPHPLRQDLGRPSGRRAAGRHLPALYRPASRA